MSEQPDHFAVVYRVDLYRPAIFEGSEEAVYKWLRNVEQVSMWWVWNRSTESYEPSADFLERLEEKYKPKPPLTKEDVQQMIDKRVGEILETLAKEAEDRSSGLAAYEVSDLMKPAFAAIATLTENIADRLAEANNREKGQGGT